MKRKILSLVLALALVFSLSSVAFAASTDAPTESTSVSSIAGVTGITVNGTSAYYEYDDNTGSGNVYIRAILPSTTTEYDLENATVQINKTMTTSIGGDIAFTGGMTSVSATVDLFNNAYTVRSIMLITLSQPVLRRELWRHPLEIPSPWMVPQ